MKPAIDQLVLVARALSDPNRVRALAALRDGELCLCQLIDLLGIAPSTASRHMAILAEAGVVSVRREGRWHYYREAGADAQPMARVALEWVRSALAQGDCDCIDAARLRDVLNADLEELTCCYRPNTAKQSRTKARARI